MTSISPNIIIAFVLVIPVTYLIIKYYKARVDKLINQNTQYQPIPVPTIDTTVSSIPPIILIDKKTKPQRLLHIKLLIPYLVSSAITAIFLFVISYNHFEGNPIDLAKTALLSCYIFSPAILLLHQYYQFSQQLQRKVFLYTAIGFGVLTLYLIMRNWHLAEGTFLAISMLLYMYAGIPLLYWILTKISRTKELIFFSYPISIIVSSILFSVVNLFSNDTQSLQTVFEPIFNALYYLGIAQHSVLVFNSLALCITLTIIYVLALIIRRLYLAKKINNLIIMMDGIWLFQIVWILSAYNNSANTLWHILGLFIMYKCIVHITYKLLFRHQVMSNQRLLVLRVFALADKGYSFFEKLKTYWAPKGSIQLIAGYDLTHSLLDIDDILYFMAGKIRNRFNLSDDLIKRNISKLDFQPDIDYRYRVNEMYCNNSTWKTVLHALVPKTDAVIMDIRQFSKKNNGSALEIQVLIQKIALDKILFIVNHLTDLDYFNTLVTDCFTALPIDSPNLHTTTPVQLLAYSSDADFDYLITHFETKK